MSYAFVISSFVSVTSRFPDASLRDSNICPGEGGGGGEGHSL